MGDCRLLWGSGLVIVTALLLGAAAHAAAIVVDTVADENGTGPDCSLREAIASANGDADVGGCAGVGAYGADTVVFASTLPLPATILLTDRAGALTVSSDVTISGPGATKLAIDGNHTTQVFHITGRLMMSELTIQHGRSLSRGGGISNAGTVMLTNCTLSGKQAPFNGGGGMYNVGTATLTNCTVSDNSTSVTGGGIFNTGGGTITLSNCTLNGNSASTTGNGGGIANSGTVMLTACTLSENMSGLGGGIFNSRGTVRLANCTLKGNSASIEGGGGIFNVDDGSVTLTDSTLSNNTARQDGGAIQNAIGTVTLSNSTLSGNSALAGGGAIQCLTGAVTLSSCTLSGNSALTGGGGVRSYCAAVTLKNTIVANSPTGDNCDSRDSGRVVSAGHNLSDDTSCPFSGPGDQNGIPAGLGSLANNGGPTQTQALCTGASMPDPSCTGRSPAIDAVPLAACTDAVGIPVAADQRGIRRPQGPACDIGAYEAERAALERAPVPTMSGSALLALTVGLGLLGLLALRRAST